MTTTTEIQDVIDQYSDLVAHIVWRVLHDREETRDVCQETFLRFCTAGIQGETITSPKAWLCRTALNLAIDNERRRSKVRHYQDRQPEVVDRTVPGSAPVENDLLVEQVRMLALQLPERQREVFILRNFEDLSYAEIGSVVGCTPETARVHEYHAVQKIRGWLGVDSEDSGGEKE